MKLSYAHTLIRAILQSSGVNCLAMNESKARACDQILSVDPALHAKESQAIADTIELMTRNYFGVSDISIYVEPGSR